MVDARGLYCLAYRKRVPRHIRHSELNDLIWRAIKKHRFQLANNRLDCPELTVKDPTSNAGSSTFSVGCNHPRHIRRIPYPGDRNFRRRSRWKDSGQQKGQVPWSGDHPYICTHRCGNEWRMVLSISTVYWRSRKENHCSHWDNLPLPEAFRVTSTRQCSSFQQHSPRDVILFTTVANLVR